MKDAIPTRLKLKCFGLNSDLMEFNWRSEIALFVSNLNLAFSIKVLLLTLSTEELRCLGKIELSAKGLHKVYELVKSYFCITENRTMS